MCVADHLLQISSIPLTAVVSSLSPLLRSVMSVSLIGIGALLQSLLLDSVTVLLLTVCRIDFVVGECDGPSSTPLSIIVLFRSLVKCLSTCMLIIFGC